MTAGTAVALGDGRMTKLSVAWLMFAACAETADLEIDQIEEAVGGGPVVVINEFTAGSSTVNT